jgi:hypothetical protein
LGWFVRGFSLLGKQKVLTQSRPRIDTISSQYYKRELLLRAVAVNSLKKKKNKKKKKMN